MRFVFLSAVCFLSCVALAVGELVGSSPQHGAGERGRGRINVRCHFQDSVVTNERGTPGQQTSQTCVGAASSALVSAGWRGAIRSPPPAFTTGWAAATQPFVTAETPAFAYGSSARRILLLLCHCGWDASSWEISILAVL